MTHRSIYYISLMCLISISITLCLPRDTRAEPLDFKVTTIAKGVPGVQANITARFDIPIEYVFQEILDVNSHAAGYPNIKRSFCISEENALIAKQKKLRNGATVKRLFYKKRCHPNELRIPGETWHYYWYQEFDYPFPLSDRWVISKVTVTEELGKKKRFELKGDLVYGRQSVYEFRLVLRPYSKIAHHTKTDLFVWTDPGGIIPDVLLVKGTRGGAHHYMKAFEKGSRRRTPQSKK